MIRKLILLALLLLVPATGWATNATTCSRTDVLSAITTAASSDFIVVVPSGTCSWSGDITLTGISLRGANYNGAFPTSSNGTVITAGAVIITKHASRVTEVNGFSFTGNANHISAGGTSSNKPYLIKFNYLHSNGADAAGRMLILTANGGVIGKNFFDMESCGNCDQDVWNAQTSETWTDGDETIGTNDTTGERNIYIEGNHISGVGETGPDGDQRSRLVIRYNTYTDSSIVFHSGYQTTAGYTDTTSGGGTRQFEVYNNDFDRISNSRPVNKWVWIRGATGVVANNKMDRSSSPDGSSYPNKPLIRLTTNCNGQAYPLEHQVGQINKVTDATPDLPVLIFGNVAGSTDGPADANFITIAGSNSGGFSCSDVDAATYIQLNRDYKTSNAWSSPWSAYTCPHPLMGSGSCSGYGHTAYTLTGGSETQVHLIIVPLIPMFFLLLLTMGAILKPAVQIAHPVLEKVLR